MLDKFFFDLQKATGLPQKELLAKLSDYKISTESICTFYLSQARYPTKSEEKIILKIGTEKTLRLFNCMKNPNTFLNYYFPKGYNLVYKPFPRKIE